MPNSGNSQVSLNLEICPAACDNHKNKTVKPPLDDHLYFK